MLMLTCYHPAFKTDPRASVLTDDRTAGPLGNRKVTVFVLVICVQDWCTVCIRCKPEPELTGEEHTQAGQQQHEGPAYLC